jgi:putative FmdB family regulatory protein
MPIYEYEPLIGDCKLCGGRFEELQSINDAPLTNCLMCDAPCRKVISRPSHRTSLPGADLSPQNLEKKGFLQYKKSGRDTWERTAGTDAQGPRVLKKDGTTE